MAFYRQYFCLIVMLCFLCIDFVESMSNTCNNNEFLHVETGKCTVCTMCDTELGLVPWRLCTNESDTLCGPLKWTPPTRVTKGHTEHDTAFQDVERSTKIRKWKTIENIMTGFLIGLGFTAVLVLVKVCVSSKCRTRETVYRIIYQGEIKSLQDIAIERNSIKEAGNIYVKTEDIQSRTCPVQSPV